MKKPVIVTKLKVTQFSAIKSMAESVYASMRFNSNFVNPRPSMPVLKAAMADLGEAIERWVKPGNRGSHADYVHLQRAAIRLHKLLTQLAAWCMASIDPDLPYPEQRSVLVTSGYPLKSDGSPQGVLEMVQNLRRFIARNVRQGQVKMRWEKPLNVTTITNVKSYLVFRSLTNDFATASVIASVSKTTYTDAPGIGDWYYWVVAVNNKGNGVKGDALMARVVVNL